MNAARNGAGEPVPAPPPTILVVEDDVLVRNFAAAYLRECGFDVIEANSADEAIRVLEAVGAHTSHVDKKTARRALQFTTQVLRNLFEIPSSGGGS